MDWPAALILSLVLGALIGLEREINAQKDIKGDSEKQKTAILGLRTFSLISGLGAINGLLYPQFPILSAIISSSFIILTTGYYVLDSLHTKDIGITTELALIYSFLIGFLLSVDIIPVQVIIALTVILVLLMSRKENIKNIVEEIKKHEINALISFAILAFVILPFLPNQTYALSNIKGSEEFFRNIGLSFDQFINLELFNPFKLWFIVVIITGVDLLGYILERTIGSKKGWLITSLVGGFVSSTATTISIAQESKHSRNQNLLLAGAVFANLISFFPIAFLLITLNTNLFLAFFPVLISLIVSATLVGLYFVFFSKQDSDTTEKKISEDHKIFDLVSALKFVGIFLVINIVSKITLELFGTAGFLATTGLGALTGVDAVVINTAQLAGSRIDLTLGVWALILANAINLLAKSVYSYLQGNFTFALKFFLSVLAIIVASIAAQVLAGFA